MSTHDASIVTDLDDIEHCIDRTLIGLYEYYQGRPLPELDKLIAELRDALKIDIRSSCLVRRAYDGH